MKKALLTAVVFGFALTCMVSSANAQGGDITFSRNTTSEVEVDTIDFIFGTASSISLDQLGTDNAFNVTNISAFVDGDPPLVELFLDMGPDNPVTSFGFVSRGNMIDPANTPSNFISDPVDGLNLLASAVNGSDIYIGFATENDEVGYFRVGFDDPDGPANWNGTVTFSDGLFSSSAIVVGSAVPEPASAVILGLFACLVATRRKR